MIECAKEKIALAGLTLVTLTRTMEASRRALWDTAVALTITIDDETAAGNNDRAAVEMIAGVIKKLGESVIIANKVAAALADGLNDDNDDDEEEEEDEE